MKDKSTLIKYTREELEHVPDETDWEKVDAMTDEEVIRTRSVIEMSNPPIKLFGKRHLFLD